MLCACGHTPVSKTAFDALGWTQDIQEVSLLPQYAYLRVNINQQDALMVLGYETPSPQGVVQTWYSRSGQTLNLQDGRLVASRGLEVDWLSVTYRELPSWQSLLKRDQSRFVRMVDVMPGYRFDVTEFVNIRRIQAPTNSKLLGLPANQLMWLEETVDGSPQGQPSARYALQQQGNQVALVYGEQCLAPNVCLAWQTWPVKR